MILKYANRIVAMLLVLLSTSVAFALPRFAARTGQECIQCHINPSGGGVRNSYGRNVFERIGLPLDQSSPSDGLSLDLDEDDLSELEASLSAGDEDVTFTGDVTNWLALGSDVRAAYLWILNDRSLTPEASPDMTSSFFLMEAYLYVAATLQKHVQLVLQFGVYLGFEAWGLFRLMDEGEDTNLLFKVGRFMPAFGVRDVQHQLFTRQSIGFGNADRDTGVEVTGYAGPLTAQVSLVNGNFGGVAFDSAGTQRQAFEMAAVGRLSLRADVGWMRGQIGGSFYYAANNDQPNPLFSGAIPPEYQAGTGLGVDDLRAGAFVTANAGRFTYLADLVYVRNDFKDPNIPVFEGYASYQELSFLPLQGLDVIAMFEFMDPNIALTENTSMRAGLALEFFPLPFTEFRLMVRRLWAESSPTGGSWDAVLFLHLFM